MEEMKKIPDGTGQIKLCGSVERIIYANEENGYTICDLATDDGDIVTAVGTMPLLGAGDFICVLGSYANNPKYGRQFSVREYERKLPADVSSILRYLSSGAIKGIGPKTAERIVEEFGEDTFEILENNPDLLARIKGITRKAAEKISEEFAKQSGMRETMLFFRDFFGAVLTVKIYNKWGKRSVDIAKRNPYRLCSEIEGIGFEKADRMAKKLGFVGDNLDRLMSGIRYVLSDNANVNGHVCLPRPRLAACSAEILEVSPEQTDAAISELIRSEGLKYMLIDGEQMIFEPAAYYAERYISEKLCEIERACPAVSAEDIGLFIAREEKRNGIEYADLQKTAITDALRYGVMILTGGPGTGKTTVVRALLHIFESMDFKIALAAPTGRAAMRLSESTSRDAKTIHRLLETGFGDGGRQTFARDENNTLDENVIIIDEASMVDNMLMYGLLKAVKPGAKFIFIGDADQLPSVGAGNVLRDIIISGRFATVELSEIFRQASRSLIVTNAHEINKGRMPELSAKDRDFFFIPRRGEREIAATVADLYKNRLPKTYGEEIKRGLQVIAPSRRGESGTQSLNILLQHAINPPDVMNKREFKYKDIIFREGDRVMQTRNNYELMWTRKSDEKDGVGIFNGDIGLILYIDTAELFMRVDFDSRVADIEFSLLEDIEHAFAITVHKSQGSEYPAVIIPVGAAPEMLLTRNLLYTAVTRAQSMVILVGMEETVEKMVENNRQSMRYTGLFRRLAVGERQNEDF